MGVMSTDCGTRMHRTDLRHLDTSFIATSARAIC
jgi:hypothetical protein